MTTTPIETIVHYPPGVTEVIGVSFSFLIGLVDDATAVKYVSNYDESDKLQHKLATEARRVLGVEWDIYRTLGEHPNILGVRGLDDIGLHLEYAVQGSIANILRNPSRTCSLQQRLGWAQQTARAVAHCHERGIIHCDLHPRNILVDANNVAKLSDFQGQRRSPSGEVLLDGYSRESPKFWKPRADEDVQNEATDIFALGSTIFYIMTGSEPFPDLDDGEEEEIQRRWKEHSYPSVETEQAGDVMRKCWSGDFQTAAAIVEALELLMHVG